MSMPMTLLKAVGSRFTTQCMGVDKPLLDGLRSAGFKLIEGPNQPSLLPLTIHRAGGFYVDVGASPLIASKQIKHKYSPNSVSRITPTSVIFPDGEEIAGVDEIIFATGYSNGRVRTRKVFGDVIADKIEPIWGFDEEGEIRGAWRRSGQDGFWVAAGSFWIGRYYSRTLALQIKMVEEGLVGL